MKLEKILKTNSPMPIEKKMVINLHIADNKAFSAMSCALKPFSISSQQFNVLRILRGQKGNPANLSTIQERMVCKMSNTTRLVDKLIEKKYVARHTCEENRRKVEIFITQEGLDLLAGIDPIVEKAEQAIVKNLSKEECHELNELLEKLRA